MRIRSARPLSVRSVAVLAGAAITPLLVALVPVVSPASAALREGHGEGGGHGSGGPLTAQTILAGSSLTHSFTVAGASTPTSEPLTKPDDITRLGRDIFVGFQNGVGPQGEPSCDGNLDSTVVELTTSGHVVAQWDIEGKADGVTADPATRHDHRHGQRGRQLLARHDHTGRGRAALRLQRALAARRRHRRHLGPGRPASTSAPSAPGTTGTLPPPQPGFPAVYTVTLDPSTSVATVTPLFGDEDPAVVANVGDAPDRADGAAGPDRPRLERDRAVRTPPASAVTSCSTARATSSRSSSAPGDHALSVLNLTQAVDDTAWPGDGGGTLFADRFDQ